MTLHEDGILYAESVRENNLDIMLINEFYFKKIDDDTCKFHYRTMSAGDNVVPDNVKADFSAKMDSLATALKTYCENMKVSFFEPAFQKI